MGFLLLESVSGIILIVYKKALHFGKKRGIMTKNEYAKGSLQTG